MGSENIKTPDITEASNVASKEAVNASPSRDQLAKQADAPHPLNGVLLAFLQDIRSIQKTHALVLPHVLKWLDKEQTRNLEKLEKYKSATNEEAEAYFARSAHQAVELH